MRKLIAIAFVVLLAGSAFAQVVPRSGSGGGAGGAIASNYFPRGLVSDGGVVLPQGNAAGTITFNGANSGICWNGGSTCISYDTNDGMGVYNLSAGAEGGSPRYWLAATDIVTGSNVGGRNRALWVQTNGMEVGFGTGAVDHATSDGVTVTFAGPVQFDGGVTITDGIGHTTVAMPDVGASYFAQGVAIDGGASIDTINTLGAIYGGSFLFGNSSSQKGTLSYANGPGALVWQGPFGGGIQTGSIGTFGNGGFTIQANAVDSASAVGITLLNSNTLSTDGAHILEIQSGGTKAFFDRNGGLKPGSGAGTLPTCNAAEEGTIVVKPAASSTPTKLCVCRSDGAGTPAFAWWSAVINTTSVWTAGTTTTCP